LGAATLGTSTLGATGVGAGAIAGTAGAAGTAGTAGFATVTAGIGTANDGGGAAEDAGAGAGGAWPLSAARIESPEIMRVNSPGPDSTNGAGSAAGGAAEANAFAETGRVCKIAGEDEGARTSSDSLRISLVTLPKSSEADSDFGGV
jgi:hypothetical protein